MEVGVIGTSKKENEHRVAIHPEHIQNIPKETRKHLHFEKKFGAQFGVEDDRISALTGTPLLDRGCLFSSMDAVLIPKPVEEDFLEAQRGMLVCGWMHSIQNSDIVQIAIERNLTLLAWENMYYRGKRGAVHIFNSNNEMAGYCGVQHALQLMGIDGNFGPSRKAIIIGFGSAGRGAISALIGHGFHDITVYTNRPPHLVADKMRGIQYKQIQRRKGKSNSLLAVESPQGTRLLIDELSEADVIVNCVYQNPEDPVVFVSNNDRSKLHPHCLVIDISCDKGMGFEFACPTSFDRPIRKIDSIFYYAVDHTPSLLWDSATREISSSFLPFLPFLVDSSPNEVLDNAIDIKNGHVINKKILRYQKRSDSYPYESLTG